MGSSGLPNLPAFFVQENIIRLAAIRISGNWYTFFIFNLNYILIITEQR